MVLVTTAGEVGAEAALLLSRQDVHRQRADATAIRTEGDALRALGVSIACPVRATVYEFDSPLRG